MSGVSPARRCLGLWRSPRSSGTPSPHRTARPRPAALLPPPHVGAGPAPSILVHPFRPEATAGQPGPEVAGLAGRLPPRAPPPAWARRAPPAGDAAARRVSACRERPSGWESRVSGLEAAAGQGREGFRRPQRPS